MSCLSPLEIAQIEGTSCLRLRNVGETFDKLSDAEIAQKGGELPAPGELITPGFRTKKWASGIGDLGVWPKPVGDSSKIIRTSRMRLNALP